jgi:hypothetical protein
MAVLNTICEIWQRVEKMDSSYSSQRDPFTRMYGANGTVIKPLNPGDYIRQQRVSNRTDY